METKLLEIRDRMTFLPCVAVAISGADGPLARRAGFGSRCILFGKIAGGGPLEYDPHSWPGRTMPVAHLWITDHWDEIEAGQVIDVEYILKEKDAPAESEATWTGF